MKAIATVLIVAAVLVASAATAGAVVGWCGNVWPVNGASYTSVDNIDVYVQVWKAGVTDQPGQGVGIEAALMFRCQGDTAYTNIGMTYNTDVGNNDEYTGIIPSGHGCAVVDFYCVITDLSDTTTCSGQDQNANDPPFLLPITEVTAQDVTVTFHMCLPTAVESSGEICVTGNHAELTSWGSGVVMEQECPGVSPRMFVVDVLFAAGSNPSVQYKFRKDACTTWEGTGNHTFAIDDAGATMDLALDSWEFQTADCPDCETPVEESTWGTVKALYR
ncbi:MAG: carbohydrate-binding module family 20 domain-containing protein [Candidatus Eisenbacteria bacterium]